MKDKKQKFFNIISILTIVFALTFSTSMNATSVSVATTTTNVALNSTHLTAISGSWWNIIKYFKCSVCGKKGCKIKHPKQNDGKCKKHHRKHKCGGNTTTPSVPLDGGLGFLMLGAAAFGVKKLRKKKDAKA